MDIVQSLLNAEKQYENQQVGFGEIRIADMARDCRLEIERLRRELQPCEPEEMLIRLAHMAGGMEARGEIELEEWELLEECISDAIKFYYDGCEYMNQRITPERAKELENKCYTDVAEALMLDRFGIPRKEVLEVEELVTIRGRLTVAGTKEDLEALFGVMHYDDNVNNAVSDLVSELQIK